MLEQLTMHITHEEKLAFSAQQMFDMVLDIQAYPQFIPYCRAMHIDGVDTESGTISACMDVGYGFLSESIPCLIVPDYHKLTITINYQKKSLTDFSARWSFYDISTQESLCQFTLTYTCHSFLKKRIIDGFIRNFFHDYITVFKNRAQHIYTPNTHISSS